MKLSIWNKIITKGLINQLRLLFIKNAPSYLRPHFYFHLLRLIFSHKSKNKRILAIWDFKVLPWSIGDPITFVETLSCLKLEIDAEKIDICLVYDENEPAGNRKHKMPNVNSENGKNHIINFFLPIFKLSPYLGNLFIFSSRKEFENYIKQNISRYEIYPSISEYLSESFNYYPTANMDLILNFYEKNNYIPKLEFSKDEIAWGYNFYKTNLPLNKLPVILSLKLTNHSIERTANQEVWGEFIKKSKNLFPDICFVIVGLREEIVEEYKSYNNVIFAKDYGTTILEDLILINNSVLMMGTVCGIQTAAMFTELPYLLFQWNDAGYNEFHLEIGDKIQFANNNQKTFHTSVQVTEELLINEFNKLYKNLDKNSWFDLAEKNASQKSSHPDAQVNKE